MCHSVTFRLTSICLTHWYRSDLRPNFGQFCWEELRFYPNHATTASKRRSVKELCFLEAHDNQVGTAADSVLS